MNSRTTNSLVKKINKHDKVTTSNDFVTASYNIDLQLEKMILFAISVVNKYEMDNKTDFDFKNPVVVSAENMVNLMYDYDSRVSLSTEETKVRFQRIRSITRSMKRFYEELKTFPAMEVKRDDKGIYEKIPMISKLAFDSKRRQLSIFFPQEFYEFFYKMATESGVKPFNRHEIKYIMKMDYYFSLRLYRYLNAHVWRNKQPLIIEYDDIHRMLNKPLNALTHQKIKEKLVQPAVDEINDFTNIKVEATYIKTGARFTAVKFDFDFKSDYIEMNMHKRIEALKIKFLKAAIPWDDNGDHFRHRDRVKHFTPPKSLTKKQITALVNQPVFLNDYGVFFGAVSDDVAKQVMSALLENKIDLLNAHKPIDLDYYLEWLKYRNSKNSDSTDDNAENTHNEAN